MSFGDSTLNRKVAVVGMENRSSLHNSSLYQSAVNPSIINTVIDDE